MNTSGIYEIINTVDGKRYIGQAVDFKRRWRLHRWQLKHGRHGNRYLQRAWDKHGPQAFEFRQLLVCAPPLLLFYEQQCVDTFAPEYNLSPTAGSPLGVKHTPETRARMSAVRRGKKRSLEARARISAALTGRKRAPFTPEHRANMATARMGNTHTLGFRPSPETRAKMAAARVGGKPNLGKKHSPEARAKISAGAKEHWRKRKAVQNTV